MGSVKDKNVIKKGPSVSRCKPPSKRKRCAHHLVGKVLNNPRPRPHEIRDARKDAITDIKKALGIDSRDYTIKEDIKDGTIRFSFQDPLDKQWVMDERPWILGYQNHLLVLDERDTPYKDMFQTCPFWVQAHGIPVKLMSKELGYDIGKVFGADQPLQVDFNENARVDFLRMRVMVNVQKRVITGCWLALPKKDDDDADDKLLWVAFVYEELPYMCFLCGIIGHTINRCDTHMSMEEIEQEKHETIIINGNDTMDEKPVVSEGKMVRDMGIRGYGSWLEDQSQFEEGYRYYDYDDPAITVPKGWRSEGRVVVPKDWNKTCDYEVSDDDDIISVVLRPKP